MIRFISSIIVLTVFAALPAQAEYARIQNESDFVSLINGKTLTRPFVSLQVETNGQINGKGAAWAVNGKWVWKDGFFCRTLEWGGDDLGYNCQEVKAYGEKVRFTSDQGSGQSAEFRLR